MLRPDAPFTTPTHPPSHHITFLGARRVISCYKMISMSRGRRLRTISGKDEESKGKRCVETARLSVFLILTKRTFSWSMFSVEESAQGKKDKDKKSPRKASSTVLLFFSFVFFIYLTSRNPYLLQRNIQGCLCCNFSQLQK